LNCKLFFILLDILAGDIFSNSDAFAIVSQVFNTSPDINSTFSTVLPVEEVIL
jgi:hypothetical protein